MNNTAWSAKTVSLLFVGIVCGWMTARISTPAALQADERKGKAPVAFKSGGERSAEILERISTQITTMDKRLAAIEAAVVGKKKK